LLDSLDLKALAADIRNDYRTSRRVRLLWVVAIATLALFALLLTESLSANKASNSFTCQSCGALNLILLVMGVVLFISAILFYNSYLRQTKERDKRRELYEFDLTTLNIPSPINTWTSTSRAIALVWLGAWIITVIAFKVNLLIAFVGLILPLVIWFFVGIWVQRPFTYADYNETDKRAELIKRWSNGNSGILSIQGLALLYGGHALKSERIHREFLAQGLKSKIFAPIALNNLARELIFQERYVEALPLLEIAINLHPNFTKAYDSLAAWYLHQDTYPERALELLNFGHQLKSSATKGATYSLRLATRGLAEARVGQTEQAKATQRAAFKLANPGYVPGYAELHRIAGLTALAYSDQAAARQYFQKAAELDPNGRIGKMAQAKLDEMSTDE
jgi:hypothetical protein